MKEMKNKILTVVIPSYNVEKYLRQTLESFVSEAIMEQIEVLIVNDGSKDSTPDIATEYAGRYPQTFRLINKENGGHGSTINKGIELAAGKYFKVVDGDDWVNTNDFIKLVKRLAEEESEYVMANYYMVYEDVNEKKLMDFPELADKKIWEFGEMADKLFIPMHALCIRTDILQENQIRLDEHCFYVDNEYTAFSIPYVQTVAYYSDLTVYMYRLALLTQSVSIKGLQKHLGDHTKVVFKLVDFVERYQKQGGEEIKVRYLENQTAMLIGIQVSIYSSFPARDVEIKNKFIQFDRQLKEKSERIYRLAEEKSKLVKVFHKNNFSHYAFWIKISQLKRKYISR